MKYAVITALVAGTTTALACIAKLLSLLFGFNFVTAVAFLFTCIVLIGGMLGLICAKYILPEEQEAEDDPDDGERKLLAA
jgi:archaellum biogenesis protein FlaJ (TadC family)